MPRPSREQWAESRAKWEADPAETFESIAQEMGVSRPAVSKRAAAEGWERVKSLREIAEKAHLQADKVTAKLSEVTGDPVKTAVAAAIDIRADVLDRHRADWCNHRKLFTLESISADFEAGKKAKISAEMLSIRQKGECAAYGLDAPAAENPGDAAAIANMTPNDIARRIAFALTAGMKESS